MKICWWQGGLHFEPEGKDEASALRLVSENLNLINVDESAPTGPVVGDLRNQKSVVGVGKLSNVIPDSL